MQAIKIEEPVEVWQVEDLPYEDEEEIMLDETSNVPDWVIEALFTNKTMGETNADELGDFWASHTLDFYNDIVTTYGNYGDYVVRVKTGLDIIPKATFDKHYRVLKGDINEVQKRN